MRNAPIGERTMSRFALPVYAVGLLLYAYIGALFAVAVHEIIGHGLISLLVGGDFKGFMISFEAYGWADTPSAFESRDTAVPVLIGGAGSTIVAGFVMGCAAWNSRKRLVVGGPLAVIAANLLLEGGLYMLVNGIYAVPPGDFGHLIEIAPVFRWPVIIVGAVVTVSTMILSVGYLTLMMRSLTRAGRDLPRRGCVALGMLVALTGAGAELAFDWNALAPGIGVWPDIGLTVLWVSIALAVTSKLPSSETAPTSMRAVCISAAVGVALLAAALLAIGLWLRHGVYF